MAHQRQTHEPSRLHVPPRWLLNKVWGQWVSQRRVDLVSNCPRNGGGDVSGIFLENTFIIPDQTCFVGGSDALS